MVQEVKKTAIPRVLIDGTGQIKTVYIDLKTYKEIPQSELKNYKLIQGTTGFAEQVDDVNHPSAVYGDGQNSLVPLKPEQIAQINRSEKLVKDGRQSTNVETEGQIGEPLPGLGFG